MTFTDYLAGYAAILSTVTFVWGISQTRSELKIDLLPEVRRFNGDLQFGVCVFIRNTSKVDIHLAAVSILYRYKIPTLREQMSFLWEFKRFPRRLGWVHSSLEAQLVDTGCPLRLEPRQSHRIFIPEYRLNSIFEGAIAPSIIANVQDQLGKDTYSRIFNGHLHSSDCLPDNAAD